MDDYIGTIIGWGPNFAPRGWAFCDGSLLPIAQYSALFSLLGTTYGGDGRTTFALPDLRGRVAVGAGQSPGLSQYQQGSKGGEETVTLNAQELASHTHGASASGLALAASTGTANTATPGPSAVPAQPEDASRNPLPVYTSAAPDTTLGSVSGDVTIAATGGNQPHENRPPYLVINYIICIEGVYPPRS
jgi:microcystin-dependent protein